MKQVVDGKAGGKNPRLADLQAWGVWQLYPQREGTDSKLELCRVALHVIPSSSCMLECLSFSDSDHKVTPWCHDSGWKNKKINPLYGALPPLIAWYIHLFFLLFSYFQQHFTIWSKTSAHELADTKFTPSMITVIIGMVFYDWKFFIIRFRDTILTCVPSPGTNIAHVILPW